MTDKRDRVLTRVLLQSSLNITAFWSFPKRSVERKVEFGEILLYA